MNREYRVRRSIGVLFSGKQYDRPIGFFQAVKYPLVAMMIMIDHARSLVYNAASAIDHEPEQSAILAHMAKSSASDMGRYASNRSVQPHGGIGYTWECFVHIWLPPRQDGRSDHGSDRHLGNAWHPFRPRVSPPDGMGD